MDVVKERGELKCGVNDNLTGFGVVKPDGSFEGFDIEDKTMESRAELVSDKDK